MDKFDTWAEVTLASGFTKTLTYGIPQGKNVVPGDLVLLSLGKKKDVPGMVVSVHHNRPDFEVKPYSERLEGYRLSPKRLQFLKWVSAYYLSSLNHCFMVALPSQIQRYHRQMQKNNLKEQNKSLNKVPEELPQLHPMQQKVVDSLASETTDQYNAYLLYGVTGSGKTRVFVERVQQVLKQNKNVLILVPEIALTPQTSAYFQKVLSEKVHLLHSNITDSIKGQVWSACFKGEAKVVMGTRSAIWLPLDNLGLIIVDEEHDGSYKQADPAPRYNAKDCALYLGYLYGCQVILGSGTPSVESWRLVEQQKLNLLEMKERIFSAEPPQIELVDMREQKKFYGEDLLSIPLREALVETLNKGEQAVLLHNRRGFASVRVCVSCGEVLRCPHCGVSMVYHKNKDSMICHYCSLIFRPDRVCDCLSHDFHFPEDSIESAMEQIQNWIPMAKIVRMDKDTTQKKGEMERILNEFRSREADVLLGTQMVAKGHDFPGVSLVGVLSGDAALGMPDFRASERTFQLIRQVAGRAGRDGRAARVLLQSWNVEDPTLQAALKNEDQKYLDGELQMRQMLRYPPFRRWLLVEMSGRNSAKVQQTLQSIRQDVLKSLGSNPVELTGISEAPLARIRGRFRWRFFVRGATQKQISDVVQPVLQLQNWERLAGAGGRLRIDMDPQNMM